MALTAKTVDLSVDLGFLTLKNPVLTASGTFGYGLEFEPYLDLEKLGGFVVKGLYYGPREGNPPPRQDDCRPHPVPPRPASGIGGPPRAFRPSTP